jgi:RNA polymerase sigma factor (sigma-70 family)
MWRVSSDAATSDAGPSDVSRAARLGGLLERARAGDRGGLHDIVRELNPLLWHVARTQGLNSEDAADVVQTAWLEFLRQLHDIRSPRAVTSWLVTTTRREAWHRRERSRRDLPDGEAVLESAVDAGPVVDERLITGERDRVLWRHFAALPERCRALLRIVSQVERPDYARIAEAFGMPRGSIGPTRGRCLAKLRELLQADPAWTP